MTRFATYGRSIVPRSMTPAGARRGRRPLAPGRGQGVAAPPAFERVEPRLLLSGNVNAFVDGDALLIFGDAAANAIRIRDFGATIVVEADPADATATTINGDDEPTIFASLGFDRVRINLRGGDDRVTIENYSAAGSLHIVGGAGDDEVVIRGAAIGGDLRVATQRGHDRVTLAETVLVGDRLVVRTGGGDDTLDVGDPIGDSGPAPGTLTVNGRTVVRMGGGQDLLAFNGDEADLFDAMFDLGPGSNFFDAAGVTIADDLRLIGGRGGGFHQVIFIDGVVGGRTTLVTGPRRDRVDLSGSVFDDRVTLRLGNADEIVSLDGAAFGGGLRARPAALERRLLSALPPFFFDGPFGFQREPFTIAPATLRFSFTDGDFFFIARSDQIRPGFADDTFFGTAPFLFSGSL